MKQFSLLRLVAFLVEELPSIRCFDPALGVDLNPPPISHEVAP